MKSTYDIIQVLFDFDTESFITCGRFINFRYTKDQLTSKYLMFINI